MKNTLQKKLSIIHVTIKIKRYRELPSSDKINFVLKNKFLYYFFTISYFFKCVIIFFFLIETFLWGTWITNYIIIQLKYKEIIIFFQIWLFFNKIAEISSLIFWTRFMYGDSRAYINEIKLTISNFSSTHITC